MKDNIGLKLKKVTVDQRLSCCDPIEWQYYQSELNENDERNICGFCAMELTDEQAKEVKALLAKNCKVTPNCGSQECLKMNPKANHKNGWTVQAPRTRKARGDAKIKKASKNANDSGEIQYKLVPKPKIYKPKKPKKPKFKKKAKGKGDRKKDES